LHNLCFVHIGDYGVESETRRRISHFGLKKCGDESSRHLLECFTFLFLADDFDGISDLDEVMFQGSSL
jgi:hypothetical protein